MFEILNIFHKAEFQYHHIYDCDLNNCKKKPKKNKHSNENLGFGEFFYCFLCWQGTWIILRVKWVLSRHQNLRFIKFKIFVGNCDLKSWRSQKNSDMQSLFWNVWILAWYIVNRRININLRRVLLFAAANHDMSFISISSSKLFQMFHLFSFVIYKGSSISDIYEIISQVDLDGMSMPSGFWQNFAYRDVLERPDGFWKL